MTEELDHKTFDLMAVLTGRDYPTLEVPIYFNDQAWVEINQLDKRRKQEQDQAARDELSDRFEALVEEASKQKFTVLLKSAPEQLRRDILAKVNEEFPPKKSPVFGGEEPHPKAEEALTKRLWAVYIQKITDPSGAITTLSEDSVEALYRDSPQSVVEAITSGIIELQTGAKSGFEAAAKETNFLSDASPEG